MSEADTFSSFSIRIGIDGRLVAAFRLATPEWRSGWDAAGNALATEPMEESVFDEASLILRIGNLRRQNLDASVSEAALAALRRAVAGIRARCDATAASVAAGALVPHSVDEDRDPATGLFGRVSLLRSLEGALAEAERDLGRPGRGPCLVIVQVEDLAALAARHGPAAAEAVLLGVADRLTENLRRIDTLARVGDALFAACLPRLGRREAAAIAVRLRRAVTSALVETPAGPLAVAVAVKVASAPPPTHGVPGILAEDNRAAAMLAAAEAQAASGRADLSGHVDAGAGAHGTVA